MAYDASLADRVRALVAGRPGVTEKAMFGGLAFLLHGKMFCGVNADDLMVRVGPDRYEEALARAHVRPMDFTGRPLRGYVYVGREGSATARDVAPWVKWSSEFVATLAEKGARSRPKR